MDKKMNINVSGGNVNIGNVVQGSRNSITNLSEQQMRDFTKGFSALREGLVKQARERNEPEDRITSLEARLAEIEIAVKSKKEVKTMGAKLKGIYDNFGWAIPVLKKTFEQILPGLIV